MTKISEGTIHKLAPEIKKSLTQNKEIKAIWESLTPLARNEFICWITSAKKEETKRINWMCDNLKKGKRRPCCWPGCPHHNENNKKWFKK